MIYRLAVTTLRRFVLTRELGNQSLVARLIHGDWVAHAKPACKKPAQADPQKAEDTGVAGDQKFVHGQDSRTPERRAAKGRRLLAGQDCYTQKAEFCASKSGARPTLQ